jgi:hypothetical protein
MTVITLGNMCDPQMGRNPEFSQPGDFCGFPQLIFTHARTDQEGFIPYPFLFITHNHPTIFIVLYNLSITVM